MTETRLYFVRHGETDYNRQRIVQGRRINSPLNETGRMQAAALARRLEDIPFDAIYSSTLRRAGETAEIIGALHPTVPLYRLSDLEEISWGLFEGRAATTQVLRELEAMIERWRAGEYGVSAEQGESILDVERRGRAALDRILTRHAGQTVLVVTHGRFLRVLLASVLEEYGLARMHEIHHANTAVNLLVHDGAHFQAAYLNCTAHLEEVETIMVE